MKSEKLAGSRIMIDGLGFDPISQLEVRQRIAAHLQSRSRKSLTLIKPYVEFFETARLNPTVRSAINQADIVAADSVAVQWAASWLAERNHSLNRFIWSFRRGIRDVRWLQRVIPERGEGATATHDLLLDAAQYGWTVGILGGPRDTTQTADGLAERYATLQLVGVWSGFASSRAAERSIRRQIKRQRPDILFVALGHPKQELFVADHAEDGLARVMIAEGGTFDYDQMGGGVYRAPENWRRLGLEWLWRLLIQPWRLRRQLAIPRFMWRMFWQARQKPAVTREISH